MPPSSQTPPLILETEAPNGLSAPAPDDRSSHVHRQLVGALGAALPLLLWLVAAFRPVDPARRWDLLGSVSAYYHTGAVSVFAGILIALTVFLFTYRGYDNARGSHDRIAANIAATAAAFVAFFPTAAPNGVTAPSWWTATIGTIHSVSATTLFAAFIYFSLFLFPLSDAKKGAPLPADKIRRNRIYRVCGVAMVVCVLWAGSALFTHAPIFWPEALALEFFAVSWLTKGRVVVTAGRAWRAIRGQQ